MAAQGEMLAARRYARALFDVAPEAQRGVVRDDLHQAAAAFASHTELREALTNPAVRPDTRGRLAGAVFAGAAESAGRLLKLLAERGRMVLLPAIARAFAEQVAEAAGVITAQATTAVALEAGQRDALTTAIRTATGHAVELETATDPSLLGGVRLTMQGRTYDGSVKSRLASLRRALSPARA
ncbi:MAG: ATP synthase F1 subunit delta [Vicinamibacteria bacterium]|jgi:F-type H+-transporting ATPase subunit delta|nr:ATP synthase F1 subunit delta [Vicinamibacteria bacterium]